MTAGSPLVPIRGWIECSMIRYLKELRRRLAICGDELD